MKCCKTEELLYHKTLDIITEYKGNYSHKKIYRNIKWKIFMSNYNSDNIFQLLYNIIKSFFKNGRRYISTNIPTPTNTLGSIDIFFYQEHMIKNLNLK